MENAEEERDELTFQMQLAELTTAALGKWRSAQSKGVFEKHPQAWKHVSKTMDQ